MVVHLVIELLVFAVSLLVLIKGSDWFINGSVKVGVRLGISPFVIGVTIVAFGTSVPELATSLAAVASGESEVVVGNVVGSNITNILLVLGLVAMAVKSIRFDYNIMDVDMPLLFVSAVFLWYVLSDGTFSTFEAILFLGGLVVFLFNTLTSRDLDRGEKEKLDWRAYLMLIGGGAMVYFGADFTVRALIGIARDFNVGSDVVAQTLVALGTSLPEVIVSLTAAKRGQAAIAVGNVLGSNIFNTYAVMAIPSFFGELVIPDEILQFGLPYMIGVTIIFAIMCLSNRISRWEGSMLVFFYLFYLEELLGRFNF